MKRVVLLSQTKIKRNAVDTSTKDITFDCEQGERVKDYSYGQLGEIYTKIKLPSSFKLKGIVIK
jgi:hypothetical protein